MTLSCLLICVRFTQMLGEEVRKITGQRDATVYGAVLRFTDEVFW